MNRIRVEDFNIEIVRKRVKNLRLSVHPPDGRIRASVPLLMSNRVIIDFIESKTGWIRKHRDSICRREKETPEKFAEGEKVLFLGKKYMLTMRENGRKHFVEQNDDIFILHAGKNSTPESRSRIIDRFYRDYLTRVLPGLFSRYEKKTGLRMREFGIKKMKTRWGSCNRKAARIWINLELAKKPVECLEYIVVHEVAHLQISGHGAEFVSFMNTYLPDWKQRRKTLNSGSY